MASGRGALSPEGRKVEPAAIGINRVTAQKAKAIRGLIAATLGKEDGA